MKSTCIIYGGIEKHYVDISSPGSLIRQFTPDLIEISKYTI